MKLRYCYNKLQSIPLYLMKLEWDEVNLENKTENDDDGDDDAAKKD